MIDYKVFDILTILEKMLGFDMVYLTDAAKSGKLKEVTLKFETTKDEHGVPVKVQHGVDLTWAQ